MFHSASQICDARALIGSGISRTFWLAKRSVAAYGVRPLTHTELLQKFAGGSEAPSGKTYEEVTRRLISEIDQVEDAFGSWCKAKWMFRVPVLLPPPEKELAQKTLRALQERIDYYLNIRATAQRDVKVITSALGIQGTTRSDISMLQRSSIEEHITNLRWNGQIDTAREVRDAWKRLETVGADDAMLVDRLCCIYGIMKMNTFNGAFSNRIRRDQASGKIVLDKHDPLSTVARTIFQYMPHIDMYYAFLGYDASNFHGALSRYMVTALEEKYRSDSKTLDGTDGLIQKNGVLFTSPDGKEFLAAPHDSSVANWIHCTQCSTDSAGEVRYLVTLVIIAKDNKYERAVQLPAERQLNGIARRMALILGVHFDNVRSRTLFLPPGYIDPISMDRLDKMLGHVARIHLPFKGQISRDLDAEHEDYEKQRKLLPEEEWSAL